MKAPDKIYVDTDLIAFHVMNERLNDVDVEYIRKDALLEWAEKQLKLYDPDYTSGGKVAKALIDKINSL